MLSRYFSALALTIGIEAVVVVACIRFVMRLPQSRISWVRLSVSVCFASCATLPYLWFVLSQYVTDSRQLALIGEPLVVIAEALFYRLAMPLKSKQAFLLSFAANAVSYGIGLVLFR